MRLLLTQGVYLKQKLSINDECHKSNSRDVQLVTHAWQAEAGAVVIMTHCHVTVTCTRPTGTDDTCCIALLM